jgi:hypothetical protein
MTNIRTETRQKQPADSRRITAASARSRLTNGKQLHAGIDGRSQPARRWRDLFRAAMERTGSRHEQLCRSLASMVIERERLDAAAASGLPVDVSLLVKLSSEIRRTQERLGILGPDGDEGEDVTDLVIARLRAQREEPAR